MTEARLQDEIRLVLGAEPGGAWFRNNSGVMTDRRGRRVAYGVGSPGGADLIGVYRGLFTAVEVKTPTGRQTPDQRLFEQLVRSKGGVYIVLRSPDEARAWLTNLECAGQ